ncbi:MAG: hypothetical protein M1142_06065 [Patescibacteria group bacterium]|nr:hypothetical protein [Patescibacteria group bacterium]
MDELETLRKKYIAVSKPDNLDWSSLESRLGSQEQPKSWPVKQFLLSITAIVIVLSIFTGAAQAARPGDQLYPLRILTDNLMAKVSGDSSQVIEKRAEDIIKVSNDPKKLGQAIEHYQQTVEDISREASGPAKKQELKTVLKKQEQKFAAEAKKNPASQPQLNQLINQTQKDEGEVKGTKTKAKDQDQEKDNHQNHREKE